MAGLVLKLRAGERVLVNGAVLEAVDRPSRLRILTPETDILRLRDAIDPDEATTPVGRLVHLLQMIVAGLVASDRAFDEARIRLTELQHAFTELGDLQILDAAMADIHAERAYPALRRLQTLLPREAALLAGTGEAEQCTNP